MKEEQRKAIELDDSMLDTVTGGTGIEKPDWVNNNNATPADSSVIGVTEPIRFMCTADGKKKLKEYAIGFNTTVEQIASLLGIAPDPDTVLPVNTRFYVRSN